MFEEECIESAPEKQVRNLQKNLTLRIWFSLLLGLNKGIIPHEQKKNEVYINGLF